MIPFKLQKIIFIFLYITMSKRPSKRENVRLTTIKDNLGKKVKQFWYASAISMTLLASSCQNQKTAPTEAREQHDKAKKERITIEKKIDKKSKELEQDKKDLIELFDNLENAKIKEERQLKEAQKESDNYKKTTPPKGNGSIEVSY